jgi:hypothetical protein
MPPSEKLDFFSENVDIGPWANSAQSLWETIVRSATKSEMQPQVLCISACGQRCNHAVVTDLDRTRELLDEFLENYTAAVFMFESISRIKDESNIVTTINALSMYVFFEDGSALLAFSEVLASPRTILTPKWQYCLPGAMVGSYVPTRSLPPKCIN